MNGTRRRSSLQIKLFCGESEVAFFFVNFYGLAFAEFALK
ncbi:MAG: hypothetical protein JWO45_2087, partial [Spartobacteria bacterium]|nr:hypothetical protein [Spartobacteria bacterium]